MGDAPGFGGVDPSQEAGAIARFAGLVLRSDACMLARESGEPVPLTRGEFSLLKMFVSRPGRVLSRDTLLDAFANRRFESFDRSVDVLVGKLRRKIEPDPKQPRLIITVAGEGYRFDGLRFKAPQIGKLTDEVGAFKLEGLSPPRLSIVVLPFANIGSDPEQEHFVDGVTESLTTDLSRIRGAYVVARNTAFTYKSKEVDLTQIDRDLNVRYVLKGSVQRSGYRMRVNVQLLDVGTGNHLWAERFDKPLADLFDMQDEIVALLANALNTELVAAEARRAERAPTPDSMDLYFQAMAWLNKGPTPGNVARACTFFDRALAADPDNVDAFVGSGFADLIKGALSFVVDPISAFAAAEAKLAKALSSVSDHAFGHTWLGFVEILTKRAEQGIAKCEHALALDRNLASAHAVIGQGKIFIGRAEETEAHVAGALRLSPRDTWSYAWMNMVGLAKLHLGSYEHAVAWFRRSTEANRNYYPGYFNLAASLAQLGRLREANCVVKAGLALNSHYTVSQVRAAWTARSDDSIYLSELDRVLEGMRKAGIPEG